MPPGVDFKTFIFPGVLAMSVLFTAIFSAASIVWDREFGFLREMLVAPVSRAAIVIGKTPGRRHDRHLPGRDHAVLAGIAHVPYNPVLILTLIGELLLLSFTITAFGVMMAARITPVPGVHGADPDARDARCSSCLGRCTRSPACPAGSAC